MVNSAQTEERVGVRVKQRVSPRSFAVGLVLALLLCAITPYNDYYVAATYLSGNFFPIGAFGAVLLLVLLVNPILIRCGKRDKIFRPAEIITIWSLMIVVSGIPSSGLMRYLIPHIVAPHYFANSGNGWEETIISKMPSRLLVNDPAAVQLFYEGLHRGDQIPWGAWARPLFWWTLFVAPLFIAYFCMATLLRKQWLENERLSFPLAKLPIMLSEAPEEGQTFNTLMRSPLLWRAVVVVTAIHTVKGLHLFFPNIPDIPLAWDGSLFLTSWPWNGLTNTTVNIYPLVIGFAFLIASDVSLSLWLFYIIFKAQCLIGIMYNWDMQSGVAGYCLGPTFISYEEAGGSAVLVAWLVYAMRPHLRDVWRKAVHNAPDVDDSAEPMPYRLALFGFLGAYAGMFLWLIFVANINVLLATSILLGSFVVFMMLSWFVTQGGLLFIQHSFSAVQLTTIIDGTTGISGPSLAMGMVTEHVGWQDAREFMLPSILNSYKGISDLGLSARSLTRRLAVCVLLAVLVSGAVSIWLPYTHGGGVAMHNPWMYTQSPQLPFYYVNSIAHNPSGPSADGLLHMIGGGLFVLILFLCRSWFPWFGLHPAGFLTAGTWAMYTLWFSLLLGWICKVVVLQFGGLKVYRRVMPFFLGLIMGDCINAIIWEIVGLITHTGYLLLPG